MTQQSAREVSTRPRRPRPRQMVMEVVDVEELSPTFKRITFGGEDFELFQDSDAVDKYVKLLLPQNPESGLKPPFDLDELRKTLPKDELPLRRTYTVHSVDHDAKTLKMDFVIHGADGLAGPWAEQAEVGDLLQFSGPGGKYQPDPTADWHLLAGDEAAIPAIGAALAALPDDAVGHALIEVATADDEWNLTAPAGVEVTWLHRGGPFTPESTVIEQAVKDVAWRDGRVQAFVHGEREIMKSLRVYLHDERGVDRADTSLSAYWAYGRAEDDFQAEKKLPIGQIYSEPGLQY
ncbi:siderophore-interacting protein [Enteractinococcus coprophilus]|uniref:NADPH-dependent ferric siderophore reductase n=1 Tax=Enteractinococcus coprophilus TaxID=1027633 RepID=A0A543AG68_9MICC|nr:siderophore-interacting protein [Enteractinococcus coprophilus]TQL71560.1 NADPH-dependent ferric siderophore reductase [Enteractinococcus coprophilus]